MVKLTGNFLIATAMEAMAEGLTLAEKNGIDRSQVIEMFGQRSIYGCFHIVCQRIVRGIW